MYSLSESLHRRAVEAGCVRIILNLLKSDNTELQFWASSLLLNLAMSSDDARSRMIRDGGVGLLLEMAVKESEVPQITSQASKTLVMLGFTGLFSCIHLILHKIESIEYWVVAPLRITDYELLNIYVIFS